MLDPIIGLPSGMFTNTGIPVVVMILKKNRTNGAPVLVIDASKDFIKVGKQNILQEKDIARIVDTYVSRAELEGYSHLASREEILTNEWNLNIPRYVESNDDEFVQDVDAHLFGGIPKSNINELTTLNSLVPSIMASSFENVRTGYVKLNKEINQLTQEVINAQQIIDIKAELKSIAGSYVTKYWDILRTVDSNSDTNSIMDDMLSDVKSITSQFKFIDSYAAYQVVAEIWKENLAKDCELIATSDFYSIGRTREPNVATKGSGKNKRQEQVGWKGMLVPNELIAVQLFKAERDMINNLSTQIQEVESQLSEIIEAAKVEDSPEYDVLYDFIKKNEDGEPQDTFDAKKVKTELKNVEKDSVEYELLHKVDKLLTSLSSKNKSVKAKEKQLNDEVEMKIETLTNTEIDELVYEKWFGNLIETLVSLIERPLREELSKISMLEKRYDKTLDEIDLEIEEAEKLFKDLASELVVVQ